jgi:hypothetical protein
MYMRLAEALHSGVPNFIASGFGDPLDLTFNDLGPHRLQDAALPAFKDIAKFKIPLHQLLVIWPSFFRGGAILPHQVPQRLSPFGNGLVAYS